MRSHRPAAVVCLGLLAASSPPDRPRDDPKDPGVPGGDPDGDGVASAEDLCPDLDDLAGQSDRDGDGRGDGCDACEGGGR